MVVDHHVIELYHYQAQKYQTGKIFFHTKIQVIALFRSWKNSCNGYVSWENVDVGIDL